MVMVQVGWGESSMIEAERLLLAEALEDPANQRFVLLSDRFVTLVYTVRRCLKHVFDILLGMLLQMAFDVERAILKYNII